ncbi:hypothetical protein Tco_1431331 [Tanacetum coccineum]
MSNQTNELKNMMASFFQMNTASTSGSGSLPSNTVANPKCELKAITTRSGLVLDGPSVLMHPLFINPEEDERVEETLMDPELAEYTIKVPPPLVQKAKPTSLKNYVVHKRDPLHPHIPYPSRMHQEKQQEKDEFSGAVTGNPATLRRTPHQPALSPRHHLHPTSHLHHRHSDLPSSSLTVAATTVGVKIPPSTSPSPSPPPLRHIPPSPSRHHLVAAITTQGCVWLYKTAPLGCV